MNRNIIKKAKKLERVCYKDVVLAKEQLRGYTNSDYMYVKAYLKGKNVHSNKWMNIFVSILGIIISLYSIVASYCGMNFSIICVVGGASFLGLIMHCVCQTKSAHRIISISIIEDLQNNKYPRQRYLGKRSRTISK